MTRSRRVVVLGAIAVLSWALPSLASSSLYASITDPVAKATVLAALIGLLGVIFTTIFSEISSYYKDRAQEIQRKWEDRAKAMQRKWELVFPLLTNFYNPWIQTAKYLSSYLSDIKESTPFSKEQASRVLFYVTLFFSVRLRLSLKAGGVPILAEDTDGEETLKAYDEVKPTLNWRGKQTRTDVSYLQEYFLEKESPEKPYLAFHFIRDIDAPEAPRELVRIRDDVQVWLSKENSEKAITALEKFIQVFDKGIRKLYEGWLIAR